MTTSFEIRVEGELARPTLHSLGCAHCVAGPQTVLRIEATPTALQELVNACSQQGMSIESIVRVGPADRPDGVGAPLGQQSPSSRPRRTASTRRFTDSLRRIPRT